MKLELRRNKDFWAGMMLIVIGGGAMFIARNYHLGTARHMGPGYFPTILGGALVVFGILILISGLRSNEKIEGPLSLRAFILLPLSLVLFAKLMEIAGFLVAILVLIFVAGASYKGFRLGELLLLSVILTIICVAVFIWGLGMPYPLIRGF